MDIVDRIQALVNEKGISIAALERNTGLSNGIIKKWKKQSPSCDKIITIANYLNVSIEYLILGTPDTKALDLDAQKLLNYYNQLDKMEKGIVLGKAEALAEIAAKQKVKDQETEHIQKAIKSLPLAADEQLDLSEQEPEYEEYYIDLCALPASAGSGVQLDEGFTEPLRIKHTSTAERANYAVRVYGDSMEPRFSNGDIVLIETCPDIDIGEIGIFTVNDQGYIKKRGEDRLISLNPDYDDILIHEGDLVYCRGRVLGKAEVTD